MTRLDAAILKTGQTREKVQKGFCPNDVLPGTTKCNTKTIKKDRKGNTKGCNGITCKKCWGKKYEV